MLFTCCDCIIHVKNLLCYLTERDTTRNIVVIRVNIFQTEKTIEIQQVCGKVLSVKNGYKSVKTALFLSNVIDADHQNSCLFTNKGHFSLPLWVLIGVLGKFHGQYFTKSSN